MTDPPAIWQISAGPVERSYADVFLSYGVGLIGPGDPGSWKPGEDDERFEGGFVRRFASEMQVGDVVVLRTGIDRIRAVGVVASDYQYLEPFDDVNGWDLQHARRIRWQRLPEEYVFSGGVFGANPTRCSRVRNEEVVDYVRRFVDSGLTRWREAPLPALPPVDVPLEKVPRELGDVVALVRDLAGLYGDTERLGDAPAENEMVAHFVVPFLRALGWAPERIAVEWRRIDVALFDALPRTPESCRFVIEAKRLGTGLEGARKQAKAYVETLGVPRDVVVTDGFRYRMFSCEEDFAPVAYANLARLKESATDLFARLRRP